MPPGLAGSRFLVSCEHGGNRVPAACRPWLAGSEELLAGHRGYDFGALTLARELAGALGAQLLASTISRLVVDLNRSLTHPALHAEAMRRAPKALRDAVLAEHYHPYRQQGEALAAAAAARGERLLHLSSHSFTPVLDGKERTADVGFLYDPARPGEVALCRRWLAALKMHAPDLRVRRNYPYVGTSDGFCAWLRRRFPAETYVGIELEINQRFPLAGGKRWRALRQTVVAALLDALGAGNR